MIGALRVKINAIAWVEMKQTYILTKYTKSYNALVNNDFKIHINSELMSSVNIAGCWTKQSDIASDQSRTRELG